MYRQTVYPYAIPLETDVLSTQRFMYEGLGLQAMDLLGTATQVAGFACTPTTPASMTVNVAPGRIYSVQNLEPSVWGQVGGVGGLASDTNADHNIKKQGMLRDTTNFACPAPGTVGQSINYLIEVSFVEADTDNIVLQFFNASNPAMPWSGPSDSGGSLPTIRRDEAVVQVKAGTAATTGTQTTPAPDAGFVGLWVVTVANGAVTITSGNITQYSAAPFIVTVPQTAGAAGTPLIWNASGQIASGTVTGTGGNFVLSASPTLNGTVTAVAANFSGLVAARQLRSAQATGISSGSVAGTWYTVLTAAQLGALAVNVPPFTASGSHAKLSCIIISSNNEVTSSFDVVCNANIAVGQQFIGNALGDTTNYSAQIDATGNLQVKTTRTGIGLGITYQVLN